MDINPFIYVDHFVTEMQELALGEQQTSENFGINRRNQMTYASSFFHLDDQDMSVKLVNPYLGIIFPQKTAYQF